jgi:anthranilate phosphoribosyltransferase
MDDLRGGDATFNAGVIRGVLNGDRGPRRDIGVLNAAAALVIAGNAVDLSEGVAQASDSLDSGRAAEVLDELVRVSAISALIADSVAGG